MLRKKSIMKKLNALRGDKRIEVFTNDDDVTNYIKKIKFHY